MVERTSKLYFRVAIVATVFFVVFNHAIFLNSSANLVRAGSTEEWDCNSFLPIGNRHSAKVAMSTSSFTPILLLGGQFFPEIFKADLGFGYYQNDIATVVFLESNKDCEKYEKNSSIFQFAATKSLPRWPAASWYTQDLQSKPGKKRPECYAFGENLSRYRAPVSIYQVFFRWKWIYNGQMNLFDNGQPPGKNPMNEDHNRPNRSAEG